MFPIKKIHYVNIMSMAMQPNFPVKVVFMHDHVEASKPRVYLYNFEDNLIVFACHFSHNNCFQISIVFCRKLKQ